MATAEVLIEAGAAEVLFVGAGLSTNRFFSRGVFSSIDIPSGGSLKGLYPLFKGICRSFKILKEFQPDVVVGFGSYHSLPALIMAKLLKIPIVLHEANSVPGKVNRLLSRYAHLTGVQFPGAATLLKGNVQQIALPLRKGYLRGHLERNAAAEYYGLDSTIKTVLIFGGSQGAEAINNAITESFLKQIKLALGPFQVLHFTGNEKHRTKLSDCYESAGIVAIIKEHEPLMDHAWSCSDLVIARAGASTIAEQLAFEIPAVYIPYPGAADNHQYLNALFVVNEVKGAILIPQDQLNSTLLAEKIVAILSEEEHKFNLIHQIQSYKQRHCKQTLSEWILKL